MNTEKLEEEINKQIEKLCTPEYFLYTARQWLINSKREYPYKIPFKDLKEGAIKNSYFNPQREYFKSFTEEDLSKALDESKYYLRDFEVVDGVFQYKYREPYTCEFTTTGKIIVENDLRDFYGHKYLDNTGATGTIEVIDHYQKMGMLHGYVGNSCPSVAVSNEKGIIQIGLKYDEDYNRILPDETFENKCSITTDLWWYSIVDLEDFKTKFPEEDESGFTVIDVPPGTYRLEHKYGITNHSHSDYDYATLKLIS